MTWCSDGIFFEADSRHRAVLTEYFGFTKDSAASAYNGDKDRKEDEQWEEVEMTKAEAKEFRGLVARLNYLAQDAP